MTALGRGLIFQPVLASLPYTQTCTYNSDNIITLQNILTLQKAWLEEGVGSLAVYAGAVEVGVFFLLVRAGAYLVFLLSRAMAGASRKLKIRHQPARTAVGEM